jgi:hypothetical protein
MRHGNATDRNRHRHAIQPGTAKSAASPPKTQPRMKPRIEARPPASAYCRWHLKDRTKPAARKRVTGPNPLAPPSLAKRTALARSNTQLNEVHPQKPTIAPEGSRLRHRCRCRRSVRDRSPRPAETPGAHPLSFLLAGTVDPGQCPPAPQRQLPEGLSPGSSSTDRPGGQPNGGNGSWTAALFQGKSPDHGASRGYCEWIGSEPNAPRFLQAILKNNWQALGLRRSTPGVAPESSRSDHAAQSPSATHAAWPTRES